MGINGIVQPEYITISPELRLRKYDGSIEFAHEWYKDKETVRLVDGENADCMITISSIKCILI